MCILPGRIDVGRHYLKTGGVEGLKQPYNSLISRVQSFGRYMFNVTDYPVIEKLFASEAFQNASKSVCPSDKQVCTSSFFFCSTLRCWTHFSSILSYRLLVRLLRCT